MRKVNFDGSTLRGFIFSCILLLLVQNAMASTVRETFKKTIAFDQEGYLSLDNANGNVQITSWEKDEVEIIAHKEVRASDRETAERMMKKLEIDIRESADEIIIETYFPKGSSGGGVFGWLFGSGGQSFSVEYEIRVPQNIDLNINTTNGKVETENVTGKLRLEATNGKIIGRDISGFARCKTTNGSIRVEFSEIPEGDKLTFKTTNGSIKLYLPQDFGGDVDLKTTNGHIDSDFPLSGRGKKSKKRYSGYIGEGNRELTCATTNGSIDLYIND
jgi:DUF4097 and DUF4098 domain-containing protein YvlB